MIKKLIPLLLIFGAIANAGAAAERNIFAADQTLIAVVRCASPAQTDARWQRLLKTVNPFYAGKNPFLETLAPRIYNEGLVNVKTDAWAEAVLFAQPLEKANHWTYVFNVANERKYVSDLLALGNIRQEVQEKSITRYRRTGEQGQSVFYLVFLRGGDGRRIGILSSNFAAAERARALYQPFIADGLLDDSADLSWVFHGTRYYLADVQCLPRFFNMLRQDLTVELAGVTAKPDNALIVFFEHLFRDLQRMVKELAIIRCALRLTDTEIKFDGAATLQYGGSVHYAVSSAPQRENILARGLPASAAAAAATTLWPELCGQIMERLGDAALAIIPAASRERVIPPVKKWYSLFNQAELQATVCGIVPGDGNACGPAVVSLLQWGKPEVLPALWQETSAMLSTGPAAEALSERGIKGEIITDPTAETLAERWSARRTKITWQTLNFKLPGILAGTARCLTAIHGNTLVIVAPAAPLDLDQYRVAEKHLLAVLTAALQNLARGGSGAAGAGNAVAAPMASPMFFQAAGHPLRFAQLALHSETVWPQPGVADRLPVPWTAFYEEVKNAPAAGAPLVYGLSVRKNQLHFHANIANRTLGELAGVFLDCRPASSAAE